MIPCPTAITDPFDLMDSLQLAHGNPTNKRTKTKLERTLSLPNEVDVSQCSTNLEYLQHMSNHLQFYRYLTDVVGTDSSEKSRKEGTVIMDLGRNKWTQPEKPSPNDIAIAQRSPFYVHYEALRSESYASTAVEGYFHVPTSTKMRVNETQWMPPPP
ncbi:hypothetical protein QR680_013673 [Steinernema hermaphroditum]|uniref:Uncharacterized protein n=1 Tax=Steinernema hermaphroditum TaxID=289476 RepID=A0AA39I8D6_9BILA|nr:hypothetical protein QR680_013673 [Steinernema hermaphroditum]